MKTPVIIASTAMLLLAGAGLAVGQTKAPAGPSPEAPPAARPERQAVPSGKAGAATAAAAVLPAATVPRIETFRIIYERNMFNAHRIGVLPRSPREGRESGSDVVTLVGTLIDQKRAAAFFDSADPRYRRVLKEGARLPSGHTLKKVEPDGIVIFRDNATAKVQVTQRLHRMENGDWEILQPESGAPAVAGSAASGADAGKTATTGPVPVIPPNASDALRRLIEQRQKQLKE